MSSNLFHKALTSLWLKSVVCSTPPIALSSIHNMRICRSDSMSSVWLSKPDCLNLKLIYINAFQIDSCSLWLLNSCTPHFDYAKRMGILLQKVYPNLPAPTRYLGTLTESKQYSNLLIWRSEYNRIPAARYFAFEACAKELAHNGVRFWGKLTFLLLASHVSEETHKRLRS